jgi:Helix-turn-helix domain
MTTNVTEDELQGRATQLRMSFDILTPEDVAALLGVETPTLADWRTHGKGPAYTKAGKNIFYRREDITAYFRVKRTTTNESGV